MKFRKQRKPRGIKLNGRKSYDMCTGCYMPHCDPFAASPKYREKIEKRLREGKCPACGHYHCRCKSTILSPEEFARKEKARHEFARKRREEEKNTKNTAES